MSMDWLSVAFHGKSRSEYPGGSAQRSNEDFFQRIQQQVCDGRVLITPVAVKTLLGSVFLYQMETLGSSKC